MLKEPRPGRVKTRLGRDIGMTAAAWWFRHQTRRLLRKVEDPRWAIVLAVAPDAEGLSSRVWPARFARWPQGQGDLGRRMVRMLRRAPPGPVCLIGADVPGIDRTQIARAFDVLGGNDMVFGPAPDGGFWLIGARQGRILPPRALDGVRWSSRHALSDTLKVLPEKRIAMGATLQDVDTADDLP